MARTVEIESFRQAEIAETQKECPHFIEAKKVRRQEMRLVEDV